MKLQLEAYAHEGGDYVFVSDTFTTLNEAILFMKAKIEQDENLYGPCIRDASGDDVEFDSSIIWWPGAPSDFKFAHPLASTTPNA